MFCLAVAGITPGTAGTTGAEFQPCQPLAGAAQAMATADPERVEAPHSDIVALLLCPDT